MESIQTNKRKCPKCDSLAANIGTSMSTCMGYSSYYDDDGNYVNNNPNITTRYYTCRKCGTSYFIREQYGKIIPVKKEGK